MNLFCRLFASLATLAFAVPALAQTGGNNGVSTVTVVETAAITPTADLRFGAFISPTTPGTVTVSANGPITTTGGVTSGANIPQPATGRGPATFDLIGGRNRLFYVLQIDPITIANNANNRMVVRFFTGNPSNALPFRRFDNRGNYTLQVGATLEVNANQQVGNYSGEFEVVAVYL